MKARIAIDTRTLGHTARFCAEGELERLEGGVGMRYRVDGDDAFLALFSDGAVMRRRGKQDLDARFALGSSEFSLSSDGMAASIPLTTSRYKPFFSASEIFCRLTYDLELHNSFQRFSLRIHIQIISEEG